MSKLPEDFDWKTYLELNSDVQQDTETKTGAIQHYLKYGIKENRVYNKKKLPNDFDWKEYLKLNPDVKKNIFTKNETINHYIKYGIKENRKYKISEKEIEKIEKIEKIENIGKIEKIEKIEKNEHIEHIEHIEYIESKIEENMDDEWNSCDDDEELMEIYAIQSLEDQDSLEDNEIVGVTPEEIDVEE